MLPSISCSVSEVMIHAAKPTPINAKHDNKHKVNVNVFLFILNSPYIILNNSFSHPF